MGLLRTYVFGYCSHVHILCSCSYGVNEDYVFGYCSSFDGLLFICLGLLFFIMFIYYVHVHMELMRTYVFGYCSSFDGLLFICLGLLFFI